MSTSPTRRGLDVLLDRYPYDELVSIDWTVTDNEPGPWIAIELGEPLHKPGDWPVWATHRYAVWRETGAVHTIAADGAVSDDPIIEPEAPEE